MSKRCASTTILLLISLFLLASCKDDNPTKPDNSTKATMANIWPHADGTAWQYEATYSDRLAATAVTAQSPPETQIPSMAELYALLQTPLQGMPTMSATGTYDLALSGNVTTESGVVAQRVVNELSLELDLPSSQNQINVTGTKDDFLRLVAQSRPDLRSKILATNGWTDKGTLEITPPYFIGGYAHAFEDSGYYGYGDLDQLHSWVYLAGDLRVGTEFTLQLLPSISTGIWLTGKIWSKGDLKVGDTTYHNVIECMYVIDLGESTGTDENGEVVATVHNYIYAVTHYAPEVGPIRGRERQLLASDNALQDPQIPTIVEYNMELTEAAVGD